MAYRATVTLRPTGQGKRKMPYASEKQRRYMHAQHPEIAARWDKEEHSMHGKAKFGNMMNHLAKKAKKRKKATKGMKY
jgi:hypothetical protein